MNNENMLKPFVNNYAFLPFLGAGFVFGLMLLFYKDLNSTLQTILVPAIAVYMIGCSFIGYLYVDLDLINCVKAANKGEKPDPQPGRLTWIFRLLHWSWFLLFVSYVFWKSVL